MLGNDAPVKLPAIKVLNKNIFINHSTESAALSECVPTLKQGE